MKTLISGALLLISMSAMAGQDALTQEFQATYNKVEALVIKKDIHALTMLVRDTRTPDFVLETKTGKSPLSKVIQSMTEVLSAFNKVTKAKALVEHVTVTGSTAVVTLSTSLSLATKPLQDRKVHVIAEEASGQDTWVKVKDKWLLKNSKIIKVAFYRDGKLSPG